MSPTCQALFEDDAIPSVLGGGGVLASLLFTQFFCSLFTSPSLVCSLYLQNSNCRFCLKTLMTKLA